MGLRTTSWALWPWRGAAHMRSPGAETAEFLLAALDGAELFDVRFSLADREADATSIERELERRDIRQRDNHD
jgi:plasmid stability protein